MDFGELIWNLGSFVGWIYNWYGFYPFELFNLAWDNCGVFWVWILNWVDFGYGFGLHIKLSFDFETLNLGLIEFILIFYILDLVDYAYILVINLEILDFDMCDISVGFNLLIWALFNWWNLSY